MPDRLLLESGTYGYLLEDASGVLLLEPFGVTVGAVDQTSYLMAHSLTLRFNSFDCTLKSPATIPALGDAVIVGAMGWQGTVVSVQNSEPPRKQAARFVHITASNANVVIAYAAPWALSDAPSPPTSYAYRDLTYTLSRTADGDTTQAHLTCYQPGLWPGMTVALTSANFGLTAANFTVNNVTVTWLDLTHWQFDVDLGDPLVTLSVWANSDSIAPITSTRITDGAVTTPKLAANAVIANVANIGGTVVIDSSGVAITGGAMTVKNPGGTTIIDGTSDMFRIAATGTISVTGFTGPGSNSNYVDLSLGLTYAPVCHTYVLFGGTFSMPTPYSQIDAATGIIQYGYLAGAQVVSSNVTRITATSFATIVVAVPTTTFRYYVMQQVSF